jgi:peptidoglycan/xylan/chitin deacetylase (PgdA/CDA1 family)
MDGTAGLTIALGMMGNEQKTTYNIYDNGGVTRFDTTKKEIYLVFTGHEFADGGEIILNVLQKQNIQASFFFTGDFYRNPKFKDLIKRIKKEKHYLGAHSDKHLLYASWEKRDSLLVTKEQFIGDLKNNYREIEKFGISTSNANWFLPPYEWYNQAISDWTKEIGLQLMNFSPGTYSNADYTTPDMKNYISSETIYSRILRFEETHTNGLNGFILLSHIGTDSKRTDKFYNKLDLLINELKKRGYSFHKM